MTALPQTDDQVEKGLQALEAFIVSKVPELAGRTVVGQADQEVAGGPPWLCIRPGYMRLDSFGGCDDIVDSSNAAAVDGAPGRITLCIGEAVGTVELVLAFTTPAERAYYTSAILQALMRGSDDDSDRHAIGVFDMGAASLIGGSTDYHATASFWLSSSMWQDEKAFVRDRRAVLELEASIGLLANRSVPGTTDTITAAFAWQSGPAPALEVDEDLTT